MDQLEALLEAIIEDKPVDAQPIFNELMDGHLNAVRESVKGAVAQNMFNVYPFDLTADKGGDEDDDDNETEDHDDDTEVASDDGDLTFEVPDDVDATAAEDEGEEDENTDENDLGENEDEPGDK